MNIINKQNVCKIFLKPFMVVCFLSLGIQQTWAKLDRDSTQSLEIQQMVLDELVAEGLIPQNHYEHQKQSLNLIKSKVVSGAKVGSASISGQVIDGNGDPLNLHIIALYSALTLNNPIGYVETDALGNFSIAGLEAGDYVVFTGTNGDGYLHYVWQNAISGGPRLCHQCNADVGTESYISVAVGEEVTGINISTELGGVISGFFKDVTTNEAISTVSAVAVNINDNSYNLTYGFSFIDEASGEYKITGIPNGSYKLFLKAKFDQNNEYIPQLYGGAQCNACSQLAFADQGTDLVIDNLNTLNNIDFDLNKGASISGKIVDSITENSLTSIALFLLFDELNHLVTTHYILGTNNDPSATGDYSIGGLLPGSYYLQGGDLGFEFYQREVYNNKPCYWSGCDRSSGDALVLGDREVATNIDFLLEKGGKISGTITSAITGLPITDANVQVQFLDGNEVVVGGARIKSDGTYTSARALPPGDYAVRTGNLFAAVLTQPYVNEKYNDVECSGLACDLTSQDVNVTVGNITTGIDFVLDTGNTFAGTITQQGNGNPIPNVHVLVYKDMGDGTVKFANWGETNDGSTAAIGSFEISGIPDGTYYAVTNNGSDLPFMGVHIPVGNGWQDILYNGINCPAGECDILSGTPIVFPTTQRGNPIIYDMSLATGASISGHVVDSRINSPITKVKVNVFNQAGVSFGSFTTQNDGFYKTAGLPADTYYLTTSSLDVLVDMKYGNTACYIGNCNPLDANPIVVGELENKENIDFVLKQDYLFSNGLETN